MKEEETDKVFRDTLQNNIEATNENDWENFEKNFLNKSSRNIRFLYLFISVLVISVISYFMIAGIPEQAKYVERSDKTNIVDPSKDSISNSQISQKKYTDSAKVDNADQLITENDPKSNPEEAINRNKSGKAVEVTNQPITRYERKSHSENDNEGGSTRSGSGTGISQINDPQLQQTESESTDDPKLANGTKSSDRISENNEGIEDKTGTASTRKRIESGTEGETDQFNNETQFSENRNDGTKLLPDRSENITNTYELSGYQLLIPLEAQIDHSFNDSGSVKDPNLILKTKSKSFGMYIFVGIEQSNILGTSPQIGLAVFRDFSKWSLSAGLGLQRSGKLNWTQESSSISYGFDRYENEFQLRTESIDLMSLPLKASYRLAGLSQVFLEFKPSLLINARQIKNVFNDGTVDNSLSESGYLYKTNAPEFIYFVSGGYTHSLSKDLEIDLGLSYSFQQWTAVAKRPFSGFIRLNYSIR